MEIEIKRLNDTGDGIGFIDGKVVFVPKTVVGDIVLIKDIQDYKKFFRASVEKKVKCGKDRIKEKCSYFDDCGGCQIMNISYDRQLQYKKDKVVNIFKKYGDIGINPEIVFDKQYGYRNKIVLEVDKGKIGFYKYHTHDLLEINKCLLVSDNINRIISLIDKKLDLTGVNRIMVRESTNNDIMIVFYGSIDINKVKEILNGKVESCYVNDKLIMGNKYITIKLENKAYTLSPQSFFQVNYDMTVKLYNRVLDYLDGDDKVMDLYCGVGSIGIFVSDKIKSILGVEIVKDAIINANNNKKINNIDNITFKCGDVEEVINSSDYYDTIIVDPPRAGLSKKTRDILLKIGAKKIIYVSCNPMTLVRDIKYMDSKYKFKEITLFDLFPNTYHVESVSLLSLKTVEK